MPEDFDEIAIVVDWLDACRKRDLVALLDLYADDASLECACDGTALVQGGAALEAYWQARFAAFSPGAFGLDEITPTADGVVLDCSGPDGRSVRISFVFSAGGKIRHTNCAPSTAISGDDCASPPAPAC